MRSADPPEWDPSSEVPRQDAEGWQNLSGLTFAQAEQVLDWLELQQVAHLEVSLAGDGVTVRRRR